MLNKRFKARYLAPVVLGAALWCAPQPVVAAESVAVTLPNFPVTLNGQAIDNAHRQYPLLTYRDITYFPLTYYDTRFLGVESQWDSATQTLSVNKSNISGGYQSATQNNGKRYTATICATPVMVNGKAVDHSKEPYPLLVFRDVTYFPMTWAYGVDEFGWQYAFDNKTGLTINSANVQPGRVKLEGLELLTREYNPHYNVRLVGDYCYYQGKDGIIYRLAADGSGQPKQVFQLPLTLSNTRVLGEIAEKDNKAVINFFVGGSAVTGHNESWQIENDGSSQRVETMSNTPVWQGDGFSASIPTGLFSTGALYIKSTDGKEQIIGSGYRQILAIVGQKVFALGSETDPADNIPKVCLYEVNVTTGQARRINDFSLRLDDVSTSDLPTNDSRYIYFVGGQMDNATGLWAERNLYRLDTTLANPQAADITLVTTLSAEAPHYAFAGQTLLYGMGTSAKQMLYKEPNNPSGNLIPFNSQGNLTNLITDQGYTIATFADLTPQNDTRLLVFDSTGQVVFRTADVAQNPHINQGRLFYVTENGQGFISQLP